MLKFDPAGFDADFFSNPEILNLLERFDAPASDNGDTFPVLAVDGDLTDLSELPEGDALNDLPSDTFSKTGESPADYTKSAFESLISDEGPGFGTPPLGDFGASEHVFSMGQLVTGSDTGFRAVDLPLDGLSFSSEINPGDNNAPEISGVAFSGLDFSDAKGGNSGGKGSGNGKGDDDGSSGGGNNVLLKYISGPTDTGNNDYYNIEIKFKGGDWTPELQAGFISSSDLISTLITEGASDIVFRGKVIDDIRIDAELFLDEGSNVLGWAGPEWYRTADGQPLTASMGFNLAYTDSMLAGGTWSDVTFHEMLHSIGFGSMWDYMGLLSGGGTENPIFTGANATTIYKTASGDSTALGVPLEQDAGPGTNDSHWNEIGPLPEDGSYPLAEGEIGFGNEIMTGFLGSSNYLSEMTVASLEDFGYETLWEQPGATSDYWSSVDIFIG